MAVVVVDGLDAGYDGVPVVRGLSFEVAAGEFVALLGPNGAGKTTTLLTVSGLLAPLRGRVEVLGAPPSIRRPFEQARHGLAHIAEDRSVFGDLTVRENLRLGSPRGAGIAAALDWFPALEPLLVRRAGLLSGGEQQMLAIGRALLSEPRVLLVDELSLGLAPVIVERILPVLRRAVDERGTAVVMVEQHVHLALEVADRGLVLRHGELVLEGSAAELAGDPAVVEASYLGRD